VNTPRTSGIEERYQEPAAARAVRRLAHWLLLAPALFLMLGLFLLSLLVFFSYSVLYTFREGKLIDEVGFGAYVNFFTDSFYYACTLDTLYLAFVVTGMTLLIGFPIAYTIPKITSDLAKRLIILTIFAPLWVSVVVRTYGWMILLSRQGVVNYFLTQLGIIQEPLRLIFNFTGVTIALVHIYLPFMVFPILSVLVQMNPTLKEAASDLGAGWFRTFLHVTLPLVLPGIAAGTQLVFTLCLGSFVTPALLGGGRVQVLPGLIYRETTAVNWPMSSVASLLLLALALVVVLLFNKVTDKFLVTR
jgi:putative spermidine/putrescine transport system permease protein